MPHWINHTFDRPHPELVQQFKDIPTSILSDSMNRFNTMEAAIKPVKADTTMVGVALTVQAMESCNWEVHQAMQLVQPGDVLVIAARGGMYAAVWGHLMTMAAKKVGLAGVVVDGCVRDSAEIKADTLPVYCRGVAPGGPHKGWQGHINVAVACAGVVVNPGDIIVGDGDGVAVVPQHKAEDVLHEARQTIAKEEAIYRRIAKGESTTDIFGLSKPE